MLESEKLSKEEQKTGLAWSKSNIFNNNKLDAFLYFVVYIVVPIVTIVFAMAKISEENLLESALCYLTILTTSLASFYDITNRWEKTKSFMNTKLVIMAIPIIIVSIYSFSQIISILTLGYILPADGLYYVYGITVLITLIEGIRCILRDLALTSAV